MRSITTVILSLCVLAGFSIQNPNIKLIKDHIKLQVKNVDSELTFEITSEVPGSNGVVHYYGNQTYSGLHIHKATFNASIKNSQVVNFHQAFVTNPESRVKSETFNLKPLQALQRLVADYQLDEKLMVEMASDEFMYWDVDLSDEVVKIYKRWYLKENQLIPVYEISLYEIDHEHWYSTRLDASTGEILDRNDWVVHCNLEGSHSVLRNALPEVNETNQVNKVDGTASYRVFAMPLESPRHGNRTIEVDPDDADASPYGWHDTDGSDGAEFTITRGNNVFARDDKDGNNSGGSSPDGGSTLTFNDSFDINQSAALFTDAAITNLFYWNNIMHDVWWHYGFDEASGNFQANNYGNGGRQNDFVRADAQDGSGTNNANFATPPDGSNPRMQMYLWGSSSSSDYFQVNAPQSAAGKYGAKRAAFGPNLSTTPITEDLVLVDDGTGVTQDGCETITNTTEISGKIAMVQRGSCPFVQKVKNAQNAGAIGVVVYNNQTATVTAMGGSDATITIPSVFIEKNNGDYISGLLGSETVNVSLYDSSFSDPSIKDSDFDNGVIAHEYGHGISNRLTGGPLAAGCLTNQEQMGEGWSDFFSLVMTHEPGDQGADKRGIGTYVRGQGVNGNGIRPHPYSTSLAISPYNYDDVKTFSVPHGVGSVWCSMLWDMYWAMIDEHGYDSDIYNGTGGNNMAMQLVIDGMKLQPCNPGFVDGRDAIILADKLNNNGQNERLIWEVFARRGLGYDADQGSTYDRGDGTEDYSMPPYLTDELIITKTAVLESKNDSALTYTIKAINSTLNTIYNVELIDTLDQAVLLNEGSIGCNSSYDDISSTLVFYLDSIVAGDTFVCLFSVIPQFETSTKVLMTEDFESGDGGWASEFLSGRSSWVRSQANPNSGDYSWYAEEGTSITDFGLVNKIMITDSHGILGFSHWYDTESGWDGGVIEIRTPTTDWEDAGPYFYMNGYNGVIGQNQWALLSGRPAFTGNSGGYINSKLDVSDFVGEELEVRFRFSCDSGTAGNGWYIDDIILETGFLVENKLNASYDPNKEDEVGVVTYIFGDAYVPNVSIKTFKAHQLNIYPNPTSDKITIESSIEKSYNVEILDANGRLVFGDKFENTTTIDVESWATGVYLIKLENENEIVQGKFIKK